MLATKNNFIESMHLLKSNFSTPEGEMWLLYEFSPMKKKKKTIQKLFRAALQGPSAFL